MIIGVLNTLVQADTSSFERGMQRAGQGVQKLAGDAKQGSGNVDSALRQLGTGAVGNLNALSKVGSVLAAPFNMVASAARQSFGVVQSFATAGASLGKSLISTLGGAGAGLGGIGSKLLAGLAPLLGASLGIATGGLLALGAAAIAAGISLHVMASRGAAEMAELGKLSREIGIGVAELSRLSAMPGLGDGEAGHAILHLQREIESGSEAAARGLQNMGLSMAELREMTPIQQLEAVYRNFGQLTNQGERSAAVMALFGRTGISMMDSLSRGSEGLEAARQRAADFGLTFTAEQEEAVRKSNKAWSGFGLALQGIGRQAAVLFTPVWQAIGDVGSEVGKWLVQAFKDAGPAMQSLGSAAWEVTKALALMIPGVGSVVAAFKDVGGDGLAKGFKVAMDWAKTFFDIVKASAKAVSGPLQAIFDGMFGVVKRLWSGLFGGAAAEVNWSGILTFFQKLVPLIEIAGEIATSVFTGVFGVISDVVGAVYDWIGSIVTMITQAIGQAINFDVGRWRGTWANATEIVMVAFAAMKVMAENWRDTAQAAIEVLKLGWLRLVKLIRDNVPGMSWLGGADLDKRIGELQSSLRMYSQGIAKQADGVVAGWRERIAAAGQAMQAATAQAEQAAQQARLAYQGLGQGGNAAPTFGSEEAFRLIESRQGNAEAYAREQVEIARRNEQTWLDILHELQRSPVLRRATL